MISCSDCNINWKDIYMFCKKKNQQNFDYKKECFDPNQIKIKSSIKNSNKFLKSKKNNQHFSIIEERKYWSKIHPKRVVDLIMNGHDAACVCCYTIYDLTFDHIIPKSKGGINSNLNGQILCSYCNKLKKDRIISIKELQKELQ